MTVQDAPGRPESIEQGPKDLPLSGALTVLGDMVAFSLGSMREVPQAWRLYPFEILRIAASIVTGSALVLWVYAFLIGMEASILAVYLLGGLGAGDYQGLFLAIAAIQAVSAPTFGWIFAAKVGCGFAAELGTMRISDEVDAVQVMGLSPRVYLSSTRMAATWLVLPFIWLVSVGVMMSAGFFINAVFASTSPGGYSTVFWNFQRPSGLLFAFIWAMVTITMIVMVACYFGYNASGGPVGVGRAAALSMGVNMVMVSVLTGIFFQLFFGLNPPIPIAN